MDGMLSQDEINALLNGMANGETIEEPAVSNTESKLADDSNQAQPISSEDAYLTDVEKDAIGEVANISMGTSATTLYSLVNRKVNITTPVVTLATWDTVTSEYEKPCVFIQIKYKLGLDGTNILVLKESDVKIITDLMMDGDGTNIEGELGELHLSAISEAMNQMMGSSATSLSSMLGRMIDISPPEASLIDMSSFMKADDIAPFLSGTFVKISFRMQIDELVDSTIMQLYPIDFARSLYDHFIHNQGALESSEAKKEPAPSIMQPEPAYQTQPMMQQPMMQQPMMQQPMMQQPMMQQPMMQQPMMQQPMMQQQMMPMQNVNIQPAQFQSFSSDINMLQSQENINLIKDVPLEVTVELGRTHKSISEILEFAPGTIVELDKIAGEPIDVLVNGKYVAKGEVVVIEESFGVRVTEIIK
ncbi:MAG: flagellar motor switch phosphatase FliY [Lachnospiraceae bacterium]|nr:flagellar motor switch phosphatase FliY [Lachnospiraceae bacterium]